MLEDQREILSFELLRNVREIGVLPDEGLLLRRELFFRGKTGFYFSAYGGTVGGGDLSCWAIFEILGYSNGLVAV